MHRNNSIVPANMLLLVVSAIAAKEGLVHNNKWYILLCITLPVLAWINLSPRQR